MVQNPLAMALPEGKFKDGDAIVARAAGGHLVFEPA